MKLIPFVAAVCSLFVAGCILSDAASVSWAQAPLPPAAQEPKNVLRNPQFAQQSDGAPVGWTPFESGFTFAPGEGREGRNAVSLEGNGEAARGASQSIVLDQKTAAPVQLIGWSKAENVSGAADNGYALFADIVYQDNTNLWGQNAPFAVGTHDWQRAELTINPEKPIKSLNFYVLLRGHSGKAWFSDLQVITQMTKASDAPLAPLEAVQNVAPRLYIATANAREAAVPLASSTLRNHLQNSGFEESADGFPRGWTKWASGAAIAPAAGRENGAALFCERREDDPERGAQQKITLNQTQREPVYLTGWSRAENVGGTSDGEYSLYADVTYSDGTQQWGINAPFSTGTHDWQQVQVTVVPQKPIQSLTVYALFRRHTGKVWFDDFRASTRSLGARGAFFDGVPVQLSEDKNPATKNAAPQVATKDGLALGLDQKSGAVTSLRVDDRELAISAPGGFLARDVANDSGYYAFQDGACAPLKLKLESRVEAKRDHLVISGHIEDTTKLDRAMSLIFALPLDARGWTWGDDVRATQTIAARGEYSQAAPMGSGSGGQSLYPLANIHDDKNGLALALDMNFPAQYRLGYNADTRQFFIAYDFALTAEKPRADFRFVIYKTEAAWGFRAATAKLYQVFPAYFALREANKKQGLWMPFVDISKVEKPEDFGFRFREASADALQNGSAAWDDAHDVLTLLYSEPMTFWMPMPVEMPRTYDAATDELRRIAADEKHPQRDMARAVISSGMRDETGQLAVIFQNQPWANGAVWSINPSPGLNDAASTRGKPTGASLVWNADKLARLKNPNGAKPDGEYLDSLEGYVSPDLNFARDAFAASPMPLTFAASSFAPAQHKGLLVAEMTRWMSRDVHAAGGLMMANSVPYRFSFLAPWLDVMGTESNWKPGGEYSPESDARMNLYRTMSGTKPYLLLQNTNFNNFGGDLVRRYMERCLFYGIFPGFFSENAATDIYWLNPKLLNRDRDLFKKYIPLVRAVAEVGWQPVTRATSDNKSVWIERFGDASAVYFTLRNDASTPQSARVTLEKTLAAKAKTSVTDAANSEKITLANGAFDLTLQPDETRVVRVR